MCIHPLLGHIRWIAIALLATRIGTARAENRVWPPQVVDGYTVTLSMAAQIAPPGDNEVVVAIQDAAGRAVTDAEVSIALLAYLRAVSTNSNSASTPNQHVHTPGASATEGQGLIPVPARLNANAEAGAYRGTEGQGLIPVPARLNANAEAGAYRGVVSFAKEGTWTVVVGFTIQGQARAVLFTIGIVDQRPRLALLGGFAAVNIGIVVAAAVRKRTTRPQGHQRARKPSGGANRPPPSS